MAKSNFPVMKSGGGLMGKAIGLVVTLTIIMLIVKYPADSATWASGAAHGVGAVVEGVVTFLRALFG